MLPPTPPPVKPPTRPPAPPPARPPAPPPARPPAPPPTRPPAPPPVLPPVAPLVAPLALPCAAAPMPPPTMRPRPPPVPPPLPKLPATKLPVKLPVMKLPAAVPPAPYRELSAPSESPLPPYGVHVVANRLLRTSMSGGRSSSCMAIRCRATSPRSFRNCSLCRSLPVPFTISICRFAFAVKMRWRSSNASAATIASVVWISVAWRNGGTRPALVAIRTILPAAFQRSPAMRAFGGSGFRGGAAVGSSGAAMRDGAAPSFVLCKALLLMDSTGRKGPGSSVSPSQAPPSGSTTLL